ncbi:MAG TPA: hypothetical protein VHU61_04495 [Solirubrobacteraceae bacterium]|jgi:hypothetical protein|nr:hypothetical protein [Solirubrobacteraceae bacterium]
MRRLLSFTAPALVALALPALAQANTGTVLSVAHSHHELQVVGANKVVSAYSFSGHLHGLNRGTRLRFSTSGSHITSATVLGSAKAFSFLGTVARSGNGVLLLSLGDSQKLRLTARQIGHSHSARTKGKSVSAEINGLQAGESVVITETTGSSGNVTITLTLPSGSGSRHSGSALSATGLVNNVGTSSFDVITASGADLTFHVDAQALANDDLSPCDSVVVSYHSAGGSLVADDVNDNGAPDSGPCSSGSDSSNDWIGTITSVSGTSVTVDAGVDDGGVQTFAVDDPAITDGFLVGDSVDVTYEPWNNQTVADTISYNDTETSGVVTSLAPAGTGFESVSMIDDYTDAAETFNVPVALLDGEDVQVGDDLDVSYYQAASGLTLDSLDDNGPSD